MNAASRVNDARRPPIFSTPEITMSNKSVLNIALALALATAGSAFAQGNTQHQPYSKDCPSGNCADPDNRQSPNQNVRRPAPPPQHPPA